MAEKILCPHCLVELAESRVCPRCGGTLDMGDWPPILGAEELSPWTPANLAAPEERGGAHALLPLDAGCVRGKVLSRLPYLFGQGKTCVRIGSSARVADICVDGAAPLHAALLLNRRTRTWWVFDCSGTGGLFVNGARVRLHELQVDDILEIAGVRLAFAGDRLESRYRSAEGLSVSVRDLTFKVPGRKLPVLDRVSFSVAPGEFIGILGPSGCGKSSLVQRLVGLSDEYEGRILVNGNDRKAVEGAFRSATAYLPQNVDETLHPTLTLAEEIDSFRRIHLAKLPSEDDEARENEYCLKTLGLSGKESSRVGNLSGGEKRRVGIALSLLRKPRLLLLDEPGAGLDPASEETLMRHLRGIADQGRTVLCVTHVLANAGKFDKLLVLSQGKVVYFGAPGKLLGTFGADSFGRLYQMLEAGTAATGEVPDEATDDSRSELPAAPARPSTARVVGGYLRRAFRQFNALKRKADGRAGLLARLTSMPMTFFFWQPLGLVFGLRIACACYFRSNGGQAVDVEMLGFCAALSMFWIGINNSARDFVKERVPGRCLERLDQVPFMPYVLAKVVWTFSVCAFQTLMFTILLCASGRIPIPLVATTGNATLAITSLWFGPLFLACLMGAACGLAVSAIARNQLGAISVVPNVAILALLFSNAVVRFEQGNDFYAPIAKTISTYVMPCHWPSKVLVGLQCGQCDATEVWATILVSGVYCLVAGLAIVFFQRRNEAAWDGR